MPFSNVNQLKNKFKLITGDISGGNNSISMRNDGVAIIDEMRKIGELTKSGNKLLFKEYFQIKNGNIITLTSEEAEGTSKDFSIRYLNPIDLVNEPHLIAHESFWT